MGVDRVHQTGPHGPLDAFGFCCELNSILEIKRKFRSSTYCMSGPKLGTENLQMKQTQ